MNMQAMLQQAKKMQKDMLDSQDKINNTEYEGKSSLVTVKMLGNKKVKDVKINLEEIELDDIELLQDMILIAVNDAIAKIDKDTEEKLGKYTKGMPGLF